MLSIRNDHDAGLAYLKQAVHEADLESIKYAAEKRRNQGARRWLKNSFENWLDFDPVRNDPEFVAVVNDPTRM